MTAYMIAEMDVTDPAAYERYKQAASDVIARYGGRYVVRGGEAAALEGPAPKRVVVVEFDSIEAAQRWYHSADYREASKLRDGAAVGRLFVVEALAAR
ncbi:MAG TPA: DUF1330 domain-containing protein [Xanthobacteraceae bacterium]|jgi:uncharacterized protein (DUF1330 family)|nr:DUF1330 domain-containing protein [Xanthobacteraceae bacterium]